jgi:hypothetical protein
MISKRKEVTQKGCGDIEIFFFEFVGCMRSELSHRLKEKKRMSDRVRSWKRSEQMVPRMLLREN